MMHQEWINALEAEFIQAANAYQAERMSAYMKNRFPFYGIMATPRREILSRFFDQYSAVHQQEWRSAVMAMWNLPQREWQYTAQELCFKMKRHWGEDELGFFTRMIGEKSWWDTVDFIAPSLAGEFLRKRPERIPGAIEGWMNSGNMWLRRSALIFQLKYKKATDEALLFRLCAQLSGEKEFFIRKAIGWSLRQYASFNPDAVKEFVKTHPLSALSAREALRKLDCQAPDA
ncbi:MAG: DNA alkylation repair protein [Bacteroidota bacterium]